MALSLLLRSSARLPGMHYFKCSLKPTWFNRKSYCIIFCWYFNKNYFFKHWEMCHASAALQRLNPQSGWTNNRWMWGTKSGKYSRINFIFFLERSSDLSISNPPVSIRKSRRIMASWACSFDWYAWNCSSRSCLSISNRRLPPCCVPCDALSLGIGSNRDGLYPWKCFRQCSSESSSRSPSSVLRCNTRRSLYDGLQRPRLRQNRQKNLGNGKQMKQQQWNLSIVIESRRCSANTK